MRIVLAEGNYLLLDQDPWADLAGSFDRRPYLDVLGSVLETRLLQRWLDRGFLPDEARRKAQGNDLRNARLILRDSRAADMLFRDG